MAIDQEDTHLLEAIAASMTRARAIDHDPAARGWVQSAVELLETAQEGFEQLVEREDVEEDEAQEALGQMRQARQDVIAAFTDVIGALEIKLGERRLAHSEDPTEQKKTQVLARFLQHWSGGELASLRTDRLSSVARSALTLAKQHEASSIATSALDHAVEELDEARTLAGEEGREAIEAYARLVEGRSVARVCYLTARDLISAALRFQGLEDDLHEVIPPLDAVLDMARDTKTA